MGSFLNLYFLIPAALSRFFKQAGVIQSLADLISENSNKLPVSVGYHQDSIFCVPTKDKTLVSFLGRTGQIMNACA